MKILILIAFACSVLLSRTFQQNVTVAIIGTNDIHGTAFPAQMIRADNQ
jgi:2',3'-cyclic-nucleotide 2'-phosphodiesterase (5'-nucleotidase family)